MTDENCPECDGEGVVYETSRFSSDGVRAVPCEKCNPEPERDDYDD